MESELMLAVEFMKNHPTDAARILESIPAEEGALFLREVPATVAGGVVRVMDSVHAAAVLAPLAAEEASAIVKELPMECGAVLLRRVGEELQRSIVEALPSDVRDPLERILRYAEGTVGALMDPEVLVLPSDISVEDALRRIREHPEHMMSYIYVVDREGFLRGCVSIRELMRAGQDAEVSAVMRADVVRLTAGLNREAIVTHTGWGEFHALPVVDEKGFFLGAIHYETLRELERKKREESGVEPLAGAGRALGELFWVGMSGLIRGTLAAVDRGQR
jgi:magnesium transporter